MNTMHTSEEMESQSSGMKYRDRRFIRAVQTLSRVVTAIFILALIWAIYQAIVNGNPLPVWAWLGVLVLLAVAIGLGVAAVVYRGVAGQAGPFDLRPSNRVSGELKSEFRRLEGDSAADGWRDRCHGGRLYL
jgi:hypothetical protein